jgi:ABC-type sugar transport system ATPase subunit
LRRLTNERVGILLVTDDMHELVNLGDRILTMKDGELAGEFGNVRERPVSEEEAVATMM